MLPEGIFKIPERAMGIWGKSTTINQNFVHIFFLFLVASKHFTIPISYYFATLYGRVYFTKKQIFDTLTISEIFHSKACYIFNVLQQERNLFRHHFELQCYLLRIKTHEIFYIPEIQYSSRRNETCSRITLLIRKYI